jgi:hypothetical protein
MKTQTKKTTVPMLAMTMFASNTEDSLGDGTFDEEDVKVGVEYCDSTRTDGGSGRIKLGIVVGVKFESREGTVVGSNVAVCVGCAVGCSIGGSVGSALGTPVGAYEGR